MLYNFVIDKNRIPVFVCIGSMKWHADSVAPRIGSILENIGFKAIGTMDNPLHGMNLSKRYKEEIEALEAMPNKYQIIAIDCSRIKDKNTVYDIIAEPIVPRKNIDDSFKHISIGEYSVHINSMRFADISEEEYKTIDTLKLMKLSDEIDIKKINALAAQVADDIINSYYESGECKNE